MKIGARGYVASRGDVTVDELDDPRRTPSSSCRASPCAQRYILERFVTAGLKE
jgi:hypothetical protein